MLKTKPGNTVKFTLTFTGVVVSTRNGFLDVRTKKGVHMITENQVVEIVDPTPPEDKVVARVRCPGCEVVAGQQCRHKQKSSQLLNHPHQERIEFWILITGWAPNDG